MKLNEYKTIPIDKLQPFLVRQLRPGVIEKLKERIAQGYNPARPLTVVPRNGHYIVADGNHRLQVLYDLKSKEVPCVVRNEDPYLLAVRCNEDEDTYAPMDLFDWLGIIKALKAEGLTQEKIGEKVGWSRDKVQGYLELATKVVAKVLDMAQQRQEGRATPDVATATFDFTEGWFRNSGLYELWPCYQYRVMNELLASLVPSGCACGSGESGAVLCLQAALRSAPRQRLGSGKTNSNILGRRLWYTLFRKK
jgi:hypothetical protein